MRARARRDRPAAAAHPRVVPAAPRFVPPFAAAPARARAAAAPRAHKHLALQREVRGELRFGGHVVLVIGTAAHGGQQHVQPRARRRRADRVAPVPR